ncbi:MAG: HEAT repeat domain-containing protein [Bacteroidales bacterium]|nr:HEAT repeat domain-containing protein [Bacteroidales bacterium]
MSIKETYLVLVLLLLFAASGGTAACGQALTNSFQADSAIVESDPADQETTDVLSVYAQRLLNRFDKSPLLVTVLYIVILYSIVTLITLLIIILLNRRRIQREQELKDYLLEMYQELLMDYLFDKEKQEEAFKELNWVANNRINRQILIDQMIDLSINLKGEIREVIQALYIRLGLKKDSLAKAYSRKWHENVKGFRELAFMNIWDANEQIIKSLNSSNNILRMEAQTAMVRLSGGNPYEFLDLLEKPLSLWEQVTLHEMQIQHDLEVPDFKRWFSSSNTTVLIFALEMVSWYKQRGAGKEIPELFNHENEKVRYTAYKVCGDIELKMALPAMIRRYPEETFKNKLEILHAFAKVPEEKNLQFLKNVLDTEEDVQLQIQATKAMENTDEPGISMLIKLMKSKSEYKNYQIIIRHVLDGRIY